jgi:hypothetical protein
VRVKIRLASSYDTLGRMISSSTPTTGRPTSSFRPPSPAKCEDERVDASRAKWRRRNHEQLACSERSGRRIFLPRPPNSPSQYSLKTHLGRSLLLIHHCVIMRRYQADPEALIRKDDLQGATDLESSQAFSVSTILSASSSMSGALATLAR